MTSEFVRKCRDRIGHHFGAALADKASDAFCEAFDPDSGNPRRPWRVIVELEPQPLPAMKFQEAVERLRAAFVARDVLAGVRSALAEVLGEDAARGLTGGMDATALVREAYVQDLHARSHRAAAHVLELLKRHTAERLAPLLPGTGPLEAVFATEYCWLSHTIRTWPNLPALLALAEDPAVRRIELPRPLSLEVAVSGVAVGAVDYRQRTGRTGKGVVVAVIDSEVKRDHPALNGRVHRSGNYSGEDWGEPHPHGTAVAGIIAGDDATHTGMAPGAIIYNYKIDATFGKEPDEFGGCCALARALLDRARIANCSWGTDAPTDGTSPVVRAVENAWGCGMTVVKSAGNDGPITSPADAKDIIVVGATNRCGTVVMGYSSRGPTQNKLNRPHLVAPGGSDASPIKTCDVDDDFSEIKKPGTSFAAAHVSGLLALLLEDKPQLTPDEQLACLLKNCKMIGQDVNAEGAGFISLQGVVSCPPP
ncbi:MAG: S8 family peptidase [Longimicrobiaceae bacterium]